MECAINKKKYVSMYICITTMMISIQYIKINKEAIKNMTYKTKSFMTKKRAFTLIELLIVIAIIGILFIVLVSKVDFATDKAKSTGVQTDFRSFQVAIESVAKEHAGLATFGWDTGDANGNRIRDSYDKGDTNKNGKQDDGEVFVGSKVYGETWTNIYTLTNPADADDTSAIAALEAAINANLDPKLHITIHDDLTITMANGAQDPWNTEYHGYYITNAEVDNKDRGAIIMYSNGANQEFGSEHSIANGVVTVNVPGNNVYGKDDYSIAVVYTFANGYGEVKTNTSGFIQTSLPSIPSIPSIPSLPIPPFEMEFNIPSTFKDDITLSDIADVYESCINKSDETIVYQSNTDMIGIMRGDLGDGNFFNMLVHVHTPESGNPIGMNIYVPKEFLDILEASIGMDISEGWNFIDLSNLNDGSPTITIIDPPVIIFDETGEFNTTSGIDDLKPLFGSSCQHDMRLLNTIQPTCTEIGYENHRCSKCYQVYIKNRTQPLGHEYDSNHLCIRCGSLREKVTGEIMDTWDEIISYVNDGSYIYRYGIGAYKTLVVDGKNIDMKIASIVGDDILTDDDVATNSAESVHITWIATTELTSSTHRLNNDEESGGWQCSLIREKLNNEIYSDLSADIKNAIVAVNKTSGRSADTSDLLWILSGREVGFTGSAFASSGPVYSQIFTDNASRKMSDRSTSYSYWLRDAHYDRADGAGWKIVSSAGSETVAATDWSSYIRFGFCI